MSRRTSAQAPRQNPARSAGDRHRPSGRRQQRQPQLDPPAGQPRRFGQAIESLRARRGDRHRLGVVDRRAAAGQGQVGGQVAVQPGRLLPGQPAAQDARAGRAVARRRGATSPCRWRRQPVPVGGQRRRRTGRASRPASSPRISATRAWNCRAASVQGSARDRRRRAASAAAISAGSAGSVRSSSTSAPSRRRRRGEHRAGGGVEAALDLSR